MEKGTWAALTATGTALSNTMLAAFMFVLFNPPSPYSGGFVAWGTTLAFITGGFMLSVGLVARSLQELLT